MPITKSAKKAGRQAARRRVFNRRRQDAVRLAIKAVKKSGTKENISAAYQAIDKAAKRGILKPRTAARRKSQVGRVTGTK